MSSQEKKRRNAGKPYNKWSEEDKKKLIEIRIGMDDMFTSKNANINDGWRRVAELLGDPNKDFKACRQLWKNLSQKYKSFFEVQTGDGAGDDGPSDRDREMESWPFFQVFHQYASKKHNYHPPFLIESSSGVVSLEPPSPSTSDNVSELASSPTLSSSSLHQFNFDSVDSSISSLPSTSRRSTTSTPSANPKLSVFEKHCIDRDKKLAKQMGALMAVFGQMVSKEYPDINVDNLLVCSSSEDE